MSRKMFGGFDLPLSPTPEISSRNSSIRITPTGDFILFFFSFRFIFFLAYGGVSSNQHHTHSSFFFGGQMGVNEWANLWMNESSSRIYFQKYQCSFHRSLWFLVGHFLNLFWPFRDWRAISSIEKQIVSVFSFIWNLEFLKIKSFKNLGLV